ncbi:NAD(P)-dependent alcohol dehydrogenase [Blastococcus atacamensis]|uniref:NAD(P)-dependent alcohol dehydrogenase n=1 Tax=Blastococcus atacamensis TaxID=2070508 RepID=UPI000CEC8F9A|nr:NAD(P)-dependent alcohol dehydrogenase [Blastococcus atacamensis]
MLALQMTGWRQDALLREVPVPRPGPGEVLVRIGAAGVCHSDIHVLTEFPEGAMPWQLPFTLGHENAGWVEEIGGGGMLSLEPGQPVALYGPWGCGVCTACSTGAENYCRRAASGAPVPGLGRDGGMAEFLLVPAARHVFPLPDGLTPLQAAPLTDAGLTPYHAVERVRDLLAPGTTTVVIGAGGLGHLAVQVLRATTASRVVVVDRRPEARALATKVGADVALDATETTAAEIRDLTDGQGADAVLDIVGTDGTLTLAASVIGSDGHIVLVGIGGGSLPVSFLGLPFGVRVSTTYWGTRPELHRVLALAARGDLVAETTAWPLSRAPEAYAAVRAGTVNGRAVVVPDPQG